MAKQILLFSSLFGRAARIQRQQSWPELCTKDRTGLLCLEEFLGVPSSVGTCEEQLEEPLRVSSWLELSESGSLTPEVRDVR